MPGRPKDADGQGETLMAGDHVSSHLCLGGLVMIPVQDDDVLRVSPNVQSAAGRERAVATRDSRLAGPG